MTETFTSLGLEGLVFTEVKKSGDDILLFLADGTRYCLGHSQSCCEWVRIEDITGDLQDLVGEPILLCEEATRDDPEAGELGMWTFYKFATRNGYVDIRWYGSSNGYYSVGVDLIMTPPPQYEEDWE